MINRHIQSRQINTFEGVRPDTNHEPVNVSNNRHNPYFCNFCNFVLLAGEALWENNSNGRLVGMKVIRNLELDVGSGVMEYRRVKGGLDWGNCLGVRVR